MGIDLPAMLLCAGYGTRMRPFSDELPKPLVPVTNHPLCEFSLRLFFCHGIRRAVVNLHHLGHLIPPALGDGARYGLSLEYSEEEVILGTGGGLVRARRLLGDGDFLVANADVLCAPDLRALLACHRERRAAATMVVRPMPAGAEYTPVWLDPDGFIARIGGEAPRAGLRPVMFEGVHVLSQAVFDFLPKAGFSCVVDQGYRALLDAGLPVAGFVDTGPWLDLGTPALYLEANLSLLSGRLRLPQLDPLAKAARPGGVMIAPGTAVAPSARLGPEVAVGEGAMIGEGASLSRCVVWAGARVEPGAIIERAVVTPRTIVRCDVRSTHPIGT
ncbi:MAG: NDP-sugar synthase [Myxococcales bacterium]|nr:NDP-sugar synthase [Myxococcales bacterium]